jgi:glycerol kinase
MLFAAVDQGTTSTRTLVADSMGTVDIKHAIVHRQFYPQPGWVEHDPLELLANVKECVAAASGVSAIGIANQGESCLAWDSISRKPLSPAIVWQDNRTARKIEALKRSGAETLTLERRKLDQSWAMLIGCGAAMLVNVLCDDDA